MKNTLQSFNEDVEGHAVQGQRQKPNEASAWSCNSIDLIQALEDALAQAGPAAPYKVSDPIPTRLLAPFPKQNKVSASSCDSENLIQALEEAIAQAGPAALYTASDPIPTRLLSSYSIANDVTTAQNTLVMQPRYAAFFTSSPESESEAALDTASRNAIAK